MPDFFLHGVEVVEIDVRGKTSVCDFLVIASGTSTRHVKSIADEYGMELLDIRLSTCAPEDLTGLPMFENGVAKFQPFDMFPLQSTPVPEGKNGWIIFLDEFNSAWLGG